MCRACYWKHWTGRRKVAGGRKSTGFKVAGEGAWYDPVVVERAWRGEPTNRLPTHAERLELAHRCVRAGYAGNGRRLARILHMDAADAARLVVLVESGEVQVAERSVLGHPIGWQPTPERRA